MAKNQPVESTQTHLQIAQIRNNVIVLKDGSLRSVLMTACLNFALKSEQEQTAIILAYQGFLNSLNFPIQIVMRSKKIDLENYLKDLDERAKITPNELLKMQIINYVDFIRQIVTGANIMDKKFFVVVPFFPPSYQRFGSIAKIFGSKQAEVKISEPDFATYMKSLNERTMVVESGLASVGIRAERLNTQQLVELFYEIYNPDVGSVQKLTQAENLKAGVIEQTPPQGDTNGQSPT